MARQSISAGLCANQPICTRDEHGSGWVVCFLGFLQKVGLQHNNGVIVTVGYQCEQFLVLTHQHLKSIESDRDVFEANQCQRQPSRTTLHKLVPSLFDRQGELGKSDACY